MKVVIVGCGKVGFTIGKNLSLERGVDVTIIDTKPEVFERASASLDVMFLRGNGLNSSALLEAGVKNADLVISVTNADETNILSCISAKKLGAKHTIARVRDPEYAVDINRLWKELGIDMFINPEQQTAREISRILRFPKASEVDTFVGGRVELVSFNVSEASSFFLGKSVSQVFNKRKMNVLLTSIERDGSALIPHGDEVFRPHDVIGVLGRPADIMNFFAVLGVNTQRIRNTVVVGGSKIAYYLVDLLQRHSNSIAIKIIDKNKEKCVALSERFPRCLILHGDGTDDEILSTEGIGNSDAIVCLTDRDEENAIMALYYKQLGARKHIVKINHINPDMVRNLGIGSIVSTKNITAERILHYVRGLSHSHGSFISTSYTIFQNKTVKIDANEIVVDGIAKCLNVPLKDLKLKKGVLIGCIVRGSQIIIPTGDAFIRQGDTVIIVVKNLNVSQLDDILS